MTDFESTESSPDDQEFELIAERHKHSSDQQVEQIKSRATPKGKLGIRTLLILISIACLFCALPVLCGVSNIWGYWLAVAFIAFLFAPMLGFLMTAVCHFMGFPIEYRNGIGVVTCLLIAAPAIVAMCFEVSPSGSLPMVVAVWGLQLAAIYFAGRVFRNQ